MRKVGGSLSTQSTYRHQPRVRGVRVLHVISFLLLVFLLAVAVEFLGLPSAPGQVSSDDQHTEAIIQAPAIANLAPASGPILSIVTINGSGFSLNSSENLVNVGSVVAPSRTVSGTQIQFILPDGLHQGQVSVTVISRGLVSNTVPFTIAAPETPDVLTRLNCTLDFTPISHLGTSLKRSAARIRVVEGGDMVFPGSVTASRGLFPTQFFDGMGLSPFAVAASVSRGSLYATPIPSRTGVVKDTPVPNLPLSSAPRTVASATTKGLATVTDGSVTFSPLPTGASTPIYTPVFVPNPDFDWRSPASPSNPLLQPGVWLETFTTFARLGIGAANVAPLPIEAGRPSGPPVPERNPSFSIAPDHLGSPQPFLDSTVLATANGLVRIRGGATSFIPYPPAAGQPVGSPVPLHNPSFSPLFPAAGLAQGDPTPFLSTLLVSVANGLVVVEGEQAEFVPVPAEAGRVISQPSAPLNPDFNLFPSASSPLDDVRLFLPSTLLVTDKGLVEIDEKNVRFTPVPEAAGRVISPAMAQLNPDFNPFFPLSSIGSPRPFLPTLLLTTTNGLVSITDESLSFIAVPAQAGQVITPPIFALNSSFNPTFDPGHPGGSPFPFERDLLVGTTNGVVVIADGTPSFLPFPLGAGMPVGSPIPVAIPGLGTEILIPVTNGLVKIDGSSSDFLTIPANAGRVIGTPFINQAGEIFLAVTNGFVQVSGTLLSFTPLPPGAGEVISLPIPAANSPEEDQFFLTTTNGFVSVANQTITFLPLPPDAGQNIAPRILLCQEPVVNQPPVANAGPDRTVPVGAPITLDGSASTDADGTIVSYFWDFGDGTTGSGQVVSHVYNLTGAFTVTLTVTDDIGTTGADTAVITVIDSTPPTVSLHSPVGGEIVSAGSSFTIRWQSADNVGVVSHDVLLATDGFSFNTPLAVNLGGSVQSLQWSVPATLATSTARIRIIARDAAGNVGRAESGLFTVRDAQPPDVTLLAPVGGETIPAGSTLSIRWSSTDNVGVSSHDLLLATDGFTFSTTIAAGLPGFAQQFDWPVPASLSTSTARLRIVARDAAGNAGQRESGLFTIRDTVPPTVSIRAPLGGESLVPGTTFTIRWNSSDNVAVTSHDILLSTDGFNFDTAIASGLSGNTQSYLWSIGLNLVTTTARLRIIARDAAGNSSQSDSGLFTVRDTIPPHVTVTRPVSGQTVSGGSGFTIRWTSSDNVAVASHDILLSTDGGFNFQTVIASGLSGNQSSFRWSVPSHLATTLAVIRVVARDAAGNVGQGESGSFIVRDTQPPSVTVVAPSTGQTVNPGTTFTIVWNSSDNVGLTSHDILLSTNGGGSFSTTLITGLAGGQQSFNWAVPSTLNTSQARIRVRAFDAAGNVGIGETGNFTIRDNMPPTVSVTSPQTGQAVNPGTLFTIRWTSADNINVISQEVQFSKNGGQTFSTLASGVGGGQHRFDWSVPIIDTSRARIRVLAFDAAGNQGQAETGNFTIRDTVKPTVEVLAPRAGQSVSPGSMVIIRWASSDNLGVVSHDVRLSTNGGRSYPTILASGLPGSQQSFDWSVAANLNTTRARIRVIARDGAGNEGRDQTGNFTIRDTVPPFVSLLAPVGGEVLPQGSQFTIRWNSSDDTGVTSHDILLSANSGSAFSTIISGLSGNQQSFNWSVPSNVSTDQARIRIVARDGAGNTGQATSGDFAIQDAIPPSVTVQRPSAGEVISAGSQFVIRWTSSDNVGVSSQNVRLSTDGGASFPTWIASGLSGGQQSFNWNVPSNLSTNQAVVQVVARDGEGNVGRGNSSVFTVQQALSPPTVRVISPNGGEVITAGNNFVIQWVSTDGAGIVSHDIFLSTDGGQTYNVTIQTGVSGDAQSVVWRVPSGLATSRGRIRVVAHDTDGLTGQDSSDHNFTIRSGGAPSGQFALVASGDLTLLGGLPGSGSIRGTVSVRGNATAVAVAPNRRFAIALTSSRVSVITGLDRQNPQESVSYEVGRNLVGVAISGDSRFAVVLVNSNPVSMVLIDRLPDNPMVESTISVGDFRDAEAIGISSSGTVVFTAANKSGAAGVAVVDGIRPGVNPTLRAFVRTGPATSCVALSRDGDTAFLVSREFNRVYVVRGLAPGGRPRLERGFISDGVGRSPRAISVSPDGSLAVLSNEGSNAVSIFRVGSGRLNLVTTVPVGNRPGGISISSDGDTAIVANSGDRTISVITSLRAGPRVTSTIGPSSQLRTESDREQSVAFVP